jgi:hypothetical protein
MHRNKMLFEFIQILSVNSWTNAVRVKKCIRIENLKVKKKRKSKFLKLKVIQTDVLLLYTILWIKIIIEQCKMYMCWSHSLI